MSEHNSEFGFYICKYRTNKTYHQKNVRFTIKFVCTVEVKSIQISVPGKLSRVKLSVIKKECLCEFVRSIPDSNSESLSYKHQKINRQVSKNTGLV